MHTKDDLENGTGVPASLNSRRQFIRAAAATGIAGIFPASLGSLTAQGSAMAKDNGNESGRALF